MLYHKMLFVFVRGSVTAKFVWFSKQVVNSASSLIRREGVSLCTIAEVLNVGIEPTPLSCKDSSYTNLIVEDSFVV